MMAMMIGARFYLTIVLLICANSVKGAPCKTNKCTQLWKKCNCGETPIDRSSLPSTAPTSNVLVAVADVHSALSDFAEFMMFVQGKDPSSINMCEETYDGGVIYSRISETSIKDECAVCKSCARRTEEGPEISRRRSSRFYAEQRIGVAPEETETLSNRAKFEEMTAHWATVGIESEYANFRWKKGNCQSGKPLATSLGGVVMEDGTTLLPWISIICEGANKNWDLAEIVTAPLPMSRLSEGGDPREEKRAEQVVQCATLLVQTMSTFSVKTPLPQMISAFNSKLVDTYKHLGFCALRLVGSGNKIGKIAVTPRQIRDSQINYGLHISMYGSETWINALPEEDGRYRTKCESIRTAVESICSAAGDKFTSLDKDTQDQLRGILFAYATVVGGRSTVRRAEELATPAYKNKHLHMLKATVQDMVASVKGVHSGKVDTIDTFLRFVAEDEETTRILCQACSRFSGGMTGNCEINVRETKQAIYGASVSVDDVNEDYTIKSGEETYAVRKQAALPVFTMGGKLAVVIEERGLAGEDPTLGVCDLIGTSDSIDACREKIRILNTPQEEDAVAVVADPLEGRLPIEPAGGQLSQQQTPSGIEKKSGGVRTSEV